MRPNFKLSTCGGIDFAHQKSKPSRPRRRAPRTTRASLTLALPLDSCYRSNDKLQTFVTAAVTALANRSAAQVR